nr:hypothetical protein [Neorhizobium tomejilense]
MAEVQKKGRSGGYKPAMNLPVRIKDVHIVAENGKMTRGKDWIEAYLLAPAFGKEARDVVKIRLVDRGVPADPEKAPLEFFDLQMGKKVKGRYKVGEFAALVIEDARETTDGFIECKWVRVAEYSYDEHPTNKDLKDLLHVGMVSVGFLNIPEAGSDRFPSQNRSAHLTHEAQIISGAGDEAIENFRQLAINALRERLDEGSARPSALFRVVNNNGIGTEQAIDAVKSVQLRTRWDKEAGAFYPAEKTVDDFLADPENAIFVNWIRHADAIANSGGTIEIWPVFEYQSGKMAVDNEVKDKNAGKHHTAEDFTAPSILMDGSAETSDRGYRRNQYGLVAEGMHKLVLLDGKKEWTADQTVTLERFPSKLYLAEQLPTHNLPEATNKYLIDLATKRVDDKKALRAAAKNNAAPAAAAEEQQNEQGQDFGQEQAPDPTAGGFRMR